MSACLELNITSEPATSLAGASRQLRDYLGRYGVGERALYATDLAIEELGTNILSYAFPPGEAAAFILRVTVKPERVELVFEDNGTPFDPTAAPAPKQAKSLEETTIGGLGIQMVRQVVKQMIYSRTEDHNRLEVEITRDSFP